MNQAKDCRWLKILAIVWMIWVISTYVLHHPYISVAISHFDYYLSLLTSLGIGLFTYWFMTGFKLKLSIKNSLRFRPILLLLPVLAIVSVEYYDILCHSLPDGQPVLEYTSNFIGLSLKHGLYLLLLCLSAYALGQRLLSWALATKLKSHSSVVSVGFGFVILTFAFFILSIITPLKVYHFWIFIIIGFAVGYKDSLRLIKKLFVQQEIESVHLGSVAIASISVILLGFSWIAGHKLYAIGFDGVNLYANVANIFAENGVIVSGVQPHNWSLFSGALAIGFDDLSMMFLGFYLPGFLIVPLMFRLSRRFLGLDKSIVVCVVWLLLPVVMYQSGSTEKVDLAFCFFCLVAIEFYLEYFSTGFSKKYLSSGPIQFGSEIIKAYSVLAIFLGFCFGVKLTAIFLLFALACVLFFQAGGFNFLKWGFLFLVGALFVSGVHLISGMNYGSMISRLLGFLMMAVAIFEFSKDFKLRRVLFSNLTKLYVILGIGVFLGIAPWLIKNGVESGKWNFTSLIEGKMSEPPIDLEKKTDISWADYVDEIPLLVLLGSSRREEMGKFLGFDEGFFKYFTVLFKNSTNPNNQNKIFVDIGFYLLLFLPLLLFFAPGPSSKRRNWLFQAFGFMVFYVCIANFLVWTQPEIGGINKADVLVGQQQSSWQALFGLVPLTLTKLFYQVGSWISEIPLLSNRSFRAINIVLSLLVLLYMKKMLEPYIRSLTKEAKLLAVIATGVLYLWYLTGTGISWYAFPAIPICYILIGHFFKEQNSSFWSVYHNFALLVLILFLFPLRFSGLNSGKGAASSVAISTSPLLYSSGFLDEKEKALSLTNVHYAKVSEILNQEKDSKIFQAGTLVRYFIDNNHRRVHADDQLHEFEMIRNVDAEDPDFFIDVLKANGFKYILFNPSDYFFDKTPEKSFLAKFNQFFRMMAKSNKVRTVYTDNQVSRPGGNITEIRGSTTNFGTIALIEIL